MKALLLISATLLSINSYAMIVHCEPNQTHSYQLQLVEDATCPSQLRAVLGRDVLPCVESEKPLEAGTYQACGTFDAERNVYVISRAVSAFLRSAPLPR